MSNQEPSLRFDHREIAVIFSLFVFVSLLMFTVGILVGKGLSQAKLEACYQKDKSILSKEALQSREDDRTLASLGTSVTTDPPASRETLPLDAPGNKSAELTSAAAVPATPAPEKPQKIELASVGTTEPPLMQATQESQPAKATPNWIPKKDSLPSTYGSGLREPDSLGPSEAEKILKDPKFGKIFENNPTDLKGRKNSFPRSFGSGKFTVQVGSYPTERDAVERVETLKKLGFQFAYTSPKEMGEGKDTWFRVWLGFFPDFQSAKDSGQILQERGEVKNYLVRKSDFSG